jgi:chemotaxis protein methyltransferase CheR
MTDSISTSDAFASFRDLIEERCGLHFDESQRRSLLASVNNRMQQLGVADIGEYYRRLRSRALAPMDEEFRQLINLVTNTETYFFRDWSHFRLLRHCVLPSLLAGRPRTIRLWSAGCSSGEEAYSIAITLSEMGCHAAGSEWAFEIVGTDLNTDVLETARRATYSPRAVRNVPGNILRRYFTERDGSYLLDEEVKRRVRFEYGNLARRPMLTPSVKQQDVVFFKNVAIYFREPVADRLIQSLRESLVDGGYLVLGHAESLWQISKGFDVVEHGGAYCYRKVDRPHRARSTATRKRRPRAISRIPHNVEPIDPPKLVDLPGDYERSLAFFRAGDWSGAETLLIGLIDAWPTFVPAHVLLGGVYAHSGRYDRAMAEAEAMLRLSALEPRAHLLVGMVAARRHQYDEALQSLRRAIYLDDSLALAHFWLGNLYRDRGDIERASHEYQNVVRDWEHHALNLTEEFAVDLTGNQLAGACRDSLKHLQEKTTR